MDWKKNQLRDCVLLFIGIIPIQRPRRSGMLQAGIEPGSLMVRGLGGQKTGHNTKPNWPSLVVCVTVYPMNSCEIELCIITCHTSEFYCVAQISNLKRHTHGFLRLKTTSGWQAEWYVGRIKHRALLLLCCHG